MVRRTSQVPRSLLEEPGPWTHRHVSAGGASFHVVDAGPPDPDHAIVLLHEFPFFWRSWRHVIPTLAQAGHRVLALDQRGFGTSDLQRDEPDLLQLARDVTAVVSSMGISEFTVVGSGMGGAVAWMLGARNPVALRSVVTISAPHPLERALMHQILPLSKGRLLEWRLDLPLRRVALLKRGRLIDGLIRQWAAPSNRERLLHEAGPYRAAMARPFAASATIDSFEATRHLGLASRRKLDAAVAVPVLSVSCDADGSLSARDFSHDREHTIGGFSRSAIRGSGHFAPEETPGSVASAILAHVTAVPPRER